MARTNAGAWLVYTTVACLPGEHNIRRYAASTGREGDAHTHANTRPFSGHHVAFHTCTDPVTQFRNPAGELREISRFACISNTCAGDWRDPPGSHG